MMLLDDFSVSCKQRLLTLQFENELDGACYSLKVSKFQNEFIKSSFLQRYTYRVLQTIQLKLILLCVWAERAVLGSSKGALKIKYEI